MALNVEQGIEKKLKDIEELLPTAGEKTGVLRCLNRIADALESIAKAQTPGYKTLEEEEEILAERKATQELRNPKSVKDVLSNYQTNEFEGNGGEA